MATIRSQKKALRNAMVATLASLPVSEIQQQSQAITDRLLESPLFQRTRNVSCYLSMPAGEVDTSALVSGILRAGKNLFVPKTDAAEDGKMDFLQVYDLDDLRDLPSGKWGIKEPPYQYRGAPRQNALDQSSGPLDVLFLPGIAFDRSLSRLGHGKGYYDRYISSYTANTRQRPLLVALALREQILEAEQVPTTLHDWKVDVITGPDGFISKLDASS